MKNLATITLFAFIASISAFLYSCGDKCKNCNTSGFECFEGACVCEPGHYLFNNNCVQLGKDSYIGINSACYCYDTLIISISGQGENRSLAMPVKFGGSVGTLTQGIFYYELPDGDSVYFPELDLRCFNQNNTPLKPAVYGKKQPNGDWNWKLVFHDALTWETIDSCNMVLKKFNG